MFQGSTNRQAGAAGTKQGRLRIGIVLAATLAVAWAFTGPAAWGKAAALRLLVKDQKAGVGIEKALARVEKPGAEPVQATSDDSGLVDLGTLDEGSYNLAVTAPGYVAYRGKLKVPAARDPVEVRLKEERTLKVTVTATANGQKQKLPASGIEIVMRQAVRPGEAQERIAKVSAKGIATCTGLVDGPACLVVSFHGCVVHSGRITVEGDAERKVELTQGSAATAVKGKMTVPRGLAVQAILFVCADSQTPGGMVRSGKTSFTVALLPGKYDVYAKCKDGCFSLGKADISGGAPTTLQLTLDASKVLTELALFGLEDKSAAAVAGEDHGPASSGPAGGAAAAAAPSVADESDAEQIKRLIPDATAMTLTDFKVLFVFHYPVDVSSLEKASLTAMLIDLRPAIENVKEAKEQFELLKSDNVIYPVANIRDEIARSPDPRRPTPPITMIHADRITGFTCQAEGDAAKGTVSYEVPQLYRGKFDYVAARAGGHWRITEFSVPACKIHVVGDELGKWRIK